MGEAYKQNMEKSTQELEDLLKRADKVDLNELAGIVFGEGCIAKNIQEIITEIRYLGSNDIRYIIRGLEGVHYLEITRNVAEHLKVDKNSWENAVDLEVIEQSIILKAFEIVWGKMTDEDKKKLQKKLEAEGFNGIDLTKGVFPMKPLIALLGTVLGRLLLKRIAGEILASLAAGPAGIVVAVINALWLVIDVAGPAYRKTVPAVVKIAYIRQKDKLSGLEGNL